MAITAFALGREDVHFQLTIAVSSDGLDRYREQDRDQIRGQNDVARLRVKFIKGLLALFRF